MSEGSGRGRPPEFILWFVVGNLFVASCLEVFLYAPSVWNLEGVVGVCDGLWSIVVRFVGVMSGILLGNMVILGRR